MKGIKSITKEEEIEKQMIEKLEAEKKYSDAKNDKLETKTNFTNEKLETLGNKVNFGHFNMSSDEIKQIAKNKPKKVKLFNEKIGEYDQICYKDQSLAKDHLISKALISNEDIIKKITLTSEDDLNTEQGFYPRLFKYLDSYRDINLNVSNVDIRTNSMSVYLFHILNHITKRKEEIEINNKILKLIETKEDERKVIHNEFFKSQEEEFLHNYLNEPIQEVDNENFKIFNCKHKIKPESGYIIDDPNQFKDQGFTSPKVLILVPFKKHAKLIVEEMISILRKGNWKGITNKTKFKEEYSEVDSFGDCFRLGISFDFCNNKLKLYQPFDESDIIIASPLGLKLTTSSNQDVKNVKVYDFLSSIEILLLDFSDIFLYQNMEHLEEILNFLNKTPKNNQNINNINRIKPNSIDNCSHLLRQSIIVSDYKSLDLDIITKEHLKNIEGVYIISEKCENIVDNIKSEIVTKREAEGLSQDVKYEMKFEFKILKPLDDLSSFDYKYNYFTKNIWKSLYETFDRHTIIFVSSTLDFLRLKSFFKQNSKAVVFISEDTDKKDWQRNRLFFEQGKYKFILYSERAHYFRKINLRFTKNIFFYSLPENPEVLEEVVQLADPFKYYEAIDKYKIEGNEESAAHQTFSSVISLVTKIEKYNLEKALGNSIASNIIRNKLDFYSC